MISEIKNIQNDCAEHELANAIPTSDSQFLSASVPSHAPDSYFFPGEALSRFLTYFSRA